MPALWRLLQRIRAEGRDVDEADDVRFAVVGRVRERLAVKNDGARSSPGSVVSGTTFGVAIDGARSRQTAKARMAAATSVPAPAKIGQRRRRDGVVSSFGAGAGDLTGAGSCSSRPMKR
jgi:hypothetical protein